MLSSEIKSERVGLMKTLEKERLKNADLEEKIRSLQQSVEGEVKLKDAERKTVLSLQTKIQDLEHIQSKLEKRVVDSDLQHQMYSKQMKHKVNVMSPMKAPMLVTNFSVVYATGMVLSSVSVLFRCVKNSVLLYGHWVEYSAIYLE